jgi:hypothetical protein
MVFFFLILCGFPSPYLEKGRIGRVPPLLSSFFFGSISFYIPSFFSFLEGGNLILLTSGNLSIV